MTRLNTQFSVKGISLLNSVMHRPAQFISKSFLFNQVDDIAGNEVSQLSKPEGTAARSQNSIGDRTEKKPWEKPGSVGGPFLLWPDDTAVQFQLLQSQIKSSQVELYCHSATCVDIQWNEMLCLAGPWCYINKHKYKHTTLDLRTLFDLHS